MNRSGDASGHVDGTADPPQGSRNRGQKVGIWEAWQPCADQSCETPVTEDWVSALRSSPGV